MKRTMLSALLGLLLTIVLGTTAVAAADRAPDCIYINLRVGDGPNFNNCSPGDGMPPPHLVVEHRDGSITQPTN
jgi:hypothetical protein